MSDNQQDLAREALRKLVAEKDTAERLRDLHEMGHGTDYDDHRKRFAAAWIEARAALSTPARHQAGEALTTLTDERIKEICREGGWDDSYQSMRFARAIDAEMRQASAARYLVATGEVHEGEETYTVHDKPVPLADNWKLYEFAHPTEAAPAAGQGEECDRPPVGWRCTRGARHEGPCAAIEDMRTVSEQPPHFARGYATGYADGLKDAASKGAAGQGEAVTDEQIDAVFKVFEGWSSATYGWQGSGDPEEDERRRAAAKQRHDDECKRRIRIALAASAPAPQAAFAIVVHRNAAGQITLKTGDGAPFDMFQHVGKSFYSAPSGEYRRIGWIVSNDEGDDVYTNNPSAVVGRHYKGHDPLPVYQRVRVAKDTPAPLQGQG